MSRLSKQEFAALLDVHPKTIERYIGPDESQDPEHVEFREATGYVKNKMNGRISFDENFARTYAAAVTGDDSKRSMDLEPDAIDAEVIPAGALQKASPGAAIERRGGNSDGADLSAAIFRAAFILPDKLLLTLAEAAEISGLSRSQIKPHCRWLSGRWKIDRLGLEIAVTEIWDKAKKSAPAKKTAFRKKKKA